MPGEAFILICAALVQLMTPGLAFFYGGLVKDTSVGRLRLMECTLRFLFKRRFHNLECSIAMVFSTVTFLLCYKVC